MAIARDAATQINSSGAWSDWNTTGTWSHTCTGSNLILFVGVETQTGTGSSGDVLTGITYNGVAMTQLLKRQRSDTDQVFQYLYYLMNPATGANNIVATVSTRSQFSYGGSASYTGVPTAPILTASVDSNAGGVATATIVTTDDNSWLVGLGFNSPGGTITASTNTAEFNTILAWGRMFDTNGAQTPAGSHSIAYTGGNGTGGVFLAAAISPNAPAVANSGFFLAASR